MNAVVLIVPLFLIRFAMLGLQNKEALRRAAHFAPMAGGEKTAYVVYQASNVFLVLYPLGQRVRTDPPLFWVAAVVYGLGMAVLCAAVTAFARPGPSGINTNGIYRLSRNPMYVGYFLYFLGCVLLTRSLPLLLALVVFQASGHWIILAEERWCIRRFGDDYLCYMDEVGRYICGRCRK